MITICLFVSLHYGSWCFTPKIQPQKTQFDIHKLAYAVARQETGGCTTGTGVTHHNCHGLMKRENGKRHPIYFATQEESYAYFEEMWTRKYGGFPTLEMAKRYVGESDAKHWLSNVSKFYEKA